MRVLLAFAPLVALAALPAQALPLQNSNDVETVVVVGRATPVPLAESSASVALIRVQPELSNVGKPLELLRSDTSVFLEQRGAGGAQSDIVLRGGSFAQTLVIVNGFRINDSQSAHHNFDLPIPLEAMEQIQVLHGAGSTLHAQMHLAAWWTLSPRPQNQHPCWCAPAQGISAKTRGRLLRPAHVGAEVAVSPAIGNFLRVSWLIVTIATKMHRPNAGSDRISA